MPPPQPSATAPPGLDVRGLTVVYGKSVCALRKVSLGVPTGGLVALLGANGAGKTTLLRALSGTLPLHQGAVTSGSVAFEGQDLTGRSPARVVAAGVAQVPEGRRVFAGLTVEDNLRAGRLGAVRRGRAELRAAADEVYALFPVLAERRHQSAGLLSGGEQQMLAMGRALMTRPKLLLLDEPSLGLAPQLVERIADTVREVRSRGTGVLLVEQNAALALELADEAYVLDVGRVRLSGPAAELGQTDEVRRLYLGEESDGQPEPSAGARSDAPRLQRWTA